MLRKLQLVLALVSVLSSQAPAPAQKSEAGGLRIDVPTKLTQAKVVIDYGHAVYQGDALFGVGDVGLLVAELKKTSPNYKVVVVFHGDAAYAVLNDETFRANRHAVGDNPFKAKLVELMSDGVQIELCGATALGNHWTNTDLITGVKVNTNAMVRVTELEQSGYSVIYQ